MITDLRSYTFYQITVAAVTIGPGPNSTIKLIETGEDSKEHMLAVCIYTQNRNFQDYVNCLFSTSGPLRRSIKNMYIHSKKPGNESFRY